MIKIWKITLTLASIFLVFGIFLPLASFALPSPLATLGSPVLEFTDISVASSVSAGSMNTITFRVVNTASYFAQGTGLFYVYLQSSIYGLQQEVFYANTASVGFAAGESKVFSFTYGAPSSSDISRLFAAAPVSAAKSAFLLLGFQMLQEYPTSGNIFENYRVLISGISDASVIDGSAVVPPAPPAMPTPTPIQTPPIVYPTPVVTPTPTPVAPVSPSPTHTPPPMPMPAPDSVPNVLNYVSIFGVVSLLATPVCAFLQKGKR